MLYFSIGLWSRSSLVTAACTSCATAANLLTKILDFRGFDSSIILIKGWNSDVHRGFPGKLESSNLSRDNISREIGRRCLAPLTPRLPLL